MLDAALLTAMASPRRLEILRLIWEEERAAGDIHRAMPDVTFGAVSLQLRTLVEAGLVDVRPEGRQRFYSARREALGDIGQTLERMWDDALWRLKLQAELEASRRGPRPRVAGAGLRPRPRPRRTSAKTTARRPPTPPCTKRMAGTPASTPPCTKRMAGTPAPRRAPSTQKRKRS